MFNTHSSRGKYILAALLGAAAGAFIVARLTRAVPEMISGAMAGMMHKMMPEMKKHCAAGGMCEQMIKGTSQGPEPTSSES